MQYCEHRMKNVKTKKKHEIRLGVHTSISGGISHSVEETVSLDCNTMQIFSHNPRQWQQRPIPLNETLKFKLLRKKYGIRPVFVHASYLINQASSSAIVRRKSISLLSYELMNADAIGAECLILHAGGISHEKNQKEKALLAKSIMKSVRSGRFRATLLLENTAVKNSGPTSSIRVLSEIIDMCHGEGIGGICVDTCHAYASGYDFNAPDGVEMLISEIDTYVGLDKLKLIHLNDSKRPLGSGIDRHEHIGKGYIGIKGFKNILSDKRISRVPMILETPKFTNTDDKRNIKKVKEILFKKIKNDQL